MELKEGMYVRTKYGITQYKEYNTTNGKLLCMPVKDGTNGIFANLEDILNASFNIIDLIEEGDYVNGYKITEIIETPRKCLKTEYKINLSYVYFCFYEKDIKSIVTREQFSQMSYKVGE